MENFKQQERSTWQVPTPTQKTVLYQKDKCLNCHNTVRYLEQILDPPYEKTTFFVEMISFIYGLQPNGAATLLLNELKNSEMVFCKSCSRILFGISKQRRRFVELTNTNSFLQEVIDKNEEAATSSTSLNSTATMSQTVETGTESNGNKPDSEFHNCIPNVPPPTPPSTSTLPSMSNNELKMKSVTESSDCGTSSNVEPLHVVIDDDIEIVGESISSRTPSKLNDATSCSTTNSEDIRPDGDQSVKLSTKSDLTDLVTNQSPKASQLSQDATSQQWQPITQLKSVKLIIQALVADPNHRLTENGIFDYISNKLAPRELAESEWREIGAAFACKYFVRIPPSQLPDNQTVPELKLDPRFEQRLVQFAQKDSKDAIARTPLQCVGSSECKEAKEVPQQTHHAPMSFFQDQGQTIPNANAMDQPDDEPQQKRKRLSSGSVAPQSNEMLLSNLNDSFNGSRSSTSGMTNASTSSGKSGSKSLTSESSPVLTRKNKQMPGASSQSCRSRVKLVKTKNGWVARYPENVSDKRNPVGQTYKVSTSSNSNIVRLKKTTPQRSSNNVQTISSDEENLSLDDIISRSRSTNNLQTSRSSKSNKRRPELRNLKQCLMESLMGSTKTRQRLPSMPELDHVQQASSSRSSRSHESHAEIDQGSQLPQILIRKDLFEIEIESETELTEPSNISHANEIPHPSPQCSVGSTIPCQNHAPLVQDTPSAALQEPPPNKDFENLKTIVKVLIKNIRKKHQRFREDFTLLQTNVRQVRFTTSEVDICSTFTDLVTIIVKLAETAKSMLVLLDSAIIGIKVKSKITCSSTSVLTLSKSPSVDVLANYFKLLMEVENYLRRVEFNCVRIVLELLQYKLKRLIKHFVRWETDGVNEAFLYNICNTLKLKSTENINDDANANASTSEPRDPNELTIADAINVWHEIRKYNEPIDAEIVNMDHNEQGVDGMKNKLDKACKIVIARKEIRQR